MADNIITVQELQDASLDAQTLEKFVNGSETQVNKPRLLPNVDIGSLAELRKKVQGKVDLQIATLPAGRKGYATLAAAQAAQASLPANTLVEVTNDTTTANNGVYLWNGTTLTKSTYEPLALSKKYTDDKIGGRLYDTDSDDVFVFTDENDNIGVGIDKAANLNANNINSKQPVTGIAWAVIDENEDIAIAVDDEGNFISSVTNKLKKDIEALQAGGIDTPQASFRLNKTDLMHIFNYGQSLSRGTNANPAISTTQPYSNLTFASGVLPKADVAHDYTSFKPLIEQNMAGNESETPTSGMLNAFVGLQVAKGDAAEKWQMVGTAPGQEGRTIAQLSKGTANYSGMLTQVQAAYDIAQAQGKTYSVWAMAWTQGENDYAGVGTTQAAYLTALLKLRDDFNTDVKAITNQSFDVPIVMYQTAAHRHTNYLKNTMQIALAQLQAANEYKNIVMACPIYHLPHAFDNIHLTSDSSQQLGRYYAKALDYSLNNSKKWQPLQPVNILRQGKIVDIEFNKSNLVIDTTLVAATHNMGFDLWSGATLLDTITSVIVTDTNRVRLVLSNIPPAGAILSYARGRVGDPQAAGNIVGARGNLRDSAGILDNYQDSVGTTRYMHNWCVMFEKTI